jgi:hypothetical protein
MVSFLEISQRKLCTFVRSAVHLILLDSVSVPMSSAGKGKIVPVLN